MCRMGCDIPLKTFLSLLMLSLRRRARSDSDLVALNCNSCCKVSWSFSLISVSSCLYIWFQRLDAEDGNRVYIRDTPRLARELIRFGFLALHLCFQIVDIGLSLVDAAIYHYFSIPDLPPETDLSPSHSQNPGALAILPPPGSASPSWPSSQQAFLRQSSGCRAIHELPSSLHRVLSARLSPSRSR